MSLEVVSNTLEVMQGRGKLAVLMARDNYLRMPAMPSLLILLAPSSLTYLAIFTLIFIMSIYRNKPYLSRQSPYETMRSDFTSSCGSDLNRDINKKYLIYKQASSEVV